MKEKKQPENVPAQSLRVAAYIRVSTLKEEQEDSYELQERYFSKLLEENPTWISAGVYSDYAISATNTDKRTGFKRLMRHCSEGRIDRIISKSISRFARNTRDFLCAIRTLDENGVTIFFEKENIDTGDKMSEFIITTLGALAQEESRSISENIRWGFRKRFPRGEARNIDIYGYRYADDEAYAVTESGYRCRNIQIVEAEAEIVQRIFHEMAAGYTYIGIARGLNRDGIPAPKRAEAGWTGERVREVADLERYVGDMLLQKGYVSDFLTHREQKNNGELPMYYVKDHHEPIISRELFGETQEVIRSKNKERRHGDTRKRYPLSGILVCASCGQHFHTYNRKSHPIWVCATVRLRNGAQKNGEPVCNMPRIFETQIINMFKEALVKRFNLTAQKNGLIIEMIKELEAVHEGEMAERELAEMNREYVRLKGEGDEQGAEKIADKINQREEYYTRLEEEYEVRGETIKWLKTLPDTSFGTAELLVGIKSEHIRTFALEIRVYSPVKYRVTWFDDSKTDIEMDSIVEDHRIKYRGEIR